MSSNSHHLAIIGLGYVGLPLAVEFSKKYKVVGFDINKVRVNELNKFVDKTLEIDSADLKKFVLKNFGNKNNGLLITNELLLSQHP
jgi:UDP-N-acetyl-D-galactosamine dehydrogenase